jgi:hypothetical protein
MECLVSRATRVCPECLELREKLDLQAFMVRLETRETEVKRDWLVETERGDKRVMPVVMDLTAKLVWLAWREIVDSQVKFFSRSSNFLNYKCSIIKTGLPGTSGLNGLMGQKGDTGPPGFVPPIDIYAPEKGSQGNVTSQKSN